MGMTKLTLGRLGVQLHGRISILRCCAAVKYVADASYAVLVYTVGFVIRSAFLIRRGVRGCGLGHESN